MTLFHSPRAVIRRLRTTCLHSITALVFLVFGPDRATAQPGTTYGFSQSTGTYTNITGGTVLISGTNWNNQRFTVGLPTPFWFDGQWYSTMYVTANGFITFGSMMANNNYNPLASGATYNGAISPFGANLQDANAASSEVRWQQIGDEIVVQWREAQRSLGGNSESFSFQTKLNTANGQIQFVYSAVTNQNISTAQQPAIGLRGAGNTFPAQVNNRSVGTGVETWTTSLNGSSNANTLRFTSASPAKAPVSGLTYTFTPPVPCVPSVSISAGPSTSICAGTTVTFTAAPTNGGTAPTYSWTRNGTVVGSGATFSSSSMANGDVIAVTMISNAPCATPNSASASLTMTVNGLPSITLTGNTSICSGTSALTLGYNSPVNSPDQFSLDWNAASNAAGLVDQGWTSLSGGTISLSGLIGTMGSYPAIMRVRNSITGCTNTVATGAVCGTANENQVLTLNAPAGSAFTTVDFASYGTPTGSCGAYAQSSCHAANSMSVVQSAALGTSSFSVNATNAVFGDPCSGTVKRLTVQASTGFVLRVNAYPTGAIVGPATICSGATATLTAPAGATYMWSTGATTASITVAPATTTTFSVVVSNGSCAQTLQHTINVATLPSITLNTTAPQVCSGNGTLQIGYTGATGSPDQFSVDWSASANAAGLADMGWTPLGAGSITLTGLIATTGNYTATISIRNSATGCFNVIAGGTLCGSVNENQALTLTAPGGGRFAGITFASYGTPNGTCGGFTLGTCHAANSLSVLQAAAVGNNSFTINASNAVFGDPCSGTFKRLHVQAVYSTFRLTINTAPAGFSAAAIVASPVLCNGGNASVSVSATGGTSPYVGTGMFNRPAGTQTFIVTEAAGCSTTTTIVIPQPSVLNATATVTTPIACDGGNATITVSASGGTGPYTGTGTFLRTAGTYSFTVTDANGCTGSASTTVTQPTALVAASMVTTPVPCHGGLANINISASGGTAPYSGTGISLRTAGSYDFIVTDANNCTASTALTIGQPQVLFASALVVSLETSCGASDAVVDVSVTGGTPSYSGNGTHIGLTAGSPVFVVSDANNCMTTAVINVPEADQDGDGTTDCGDECPNDPLKILTGQCGCGVPEGDTDLDGTADCMDNCPNDAAKINPGQCGCGAADSDTDGDTYADCVDGCPLDPLKIGPGTCGCGQADADTDGDGIMDCFDACPSGPEPGSPCDDGDPTTSNDVIDNDCNCAGDPALVSDEILRLHLTTDGNGPQTSWEIVPLAGGNALCSGVSLPSNTTSVLPCQVPDGEYVLRIMDSAGDGMCCTDGNGGFMLTRADGRRIIDASEGATFGSLSSVPAGFSLPLGTDGLTPSRCDREDLLPDDFIQAIPNDAVRSQYGDNNHNSGYQFWIFDPNGGYSRRMLVTHTTGSYIFPPGEDRCSYLRLSQMETNPIPHDRMLNVRVRSLVNGTYNAFGPACRLRIDLPGSCPVTQLVDNADDPHHSCGISGVLLDGSRVLYAVPVSQVTHYQFEFACGSYLRRISSTGSGLLLTEWAQSPLEYGMKNYTVRVRVSYDNEATWCPFGPSCGITTAAGEPSQPRAATVVGSEPANLRVWPNPLRDGDLNVLLGGLRDEETSANLTMIDLQGRMIADQRIAAQDGSLNVQLTADEKLPSGTYLLTIRTTGRSWTERIVVE